MTDRGDICLGAKMIEVQGTFIPCFFLLLFFFNIRVSENETKFESFIEKSTTIYLIESIKSTV